MSAWRHYAQKQRQAMVQVPLAATYLAVRLLQEEPEAEPLLADLLKYLRTALGSCSSGGHSVVHAVLAARRAAIPLDRNDLDCLFAAGALADGSVKNRSFRCQEQLLGLGYFDLEQTATIDIQHQRTNFFAQAASNNCGRCWQGLKSRSVVLLRMKARRLCWHWTSAPPGCKEYAMVWSRPFLLPMASRWNVVSMFVVPLPALKKNSSPTPR
jgi:hypothetical protein